MPLRRLLACGLLALACDLPPAPQAARDVPQPAAAAVAAAVPAESPVRPVRLDLAAIDAYVAAQVERHGHVGLSLAIVRDGEIVLARGYGKRSLATGDPVDTSTAFAIGSVSKQFTCAAALLLAEGGRLRLDDRLSTYYPGLTRAWDITLDHLLSHTSGIHDYYPLDFVDERMRQPIDPDALIRLYADGPLDFEPGARYSYSNTGFVIVGRVVERLAGEPFADFLQHRIFGPLAMTTAAFAPPPDAPGLATGHTSFSLGPPVPAVPEAPGWVGAAGALVMSPTDLARWDLALMRDELFKDPRSWTALTTPRILTGGEPSDYACGLAVARRQGETVLQHSGAVSGFLAWNAMVPRTKSAVILLTNADFVDGASLHGELLSLVIDAGKPIPAVPGDDPRTVALRLLREYQAGVVDRTKLGPPFSAFLTDERLREAAPRLAALGDPTSVVVERLGERGGMEVATLRLTFQTRTARALLYRDKRGTVQQFLLLRD